MNDISNNIWISTILASILLSGCATSSTPKASLYDRLGGKEAITAVVAEFIQQVAADERINDHFKKTIDDGKIPVLQFMLVEQICEATGGPCKYPGRDMKTTHDGMNITDADFIALVEDLQIALDKFKVGTTEQNQLIQALAPMKKDIVYR